MFLSEKSIYLFIFCQGERKQLYLACVMGTYIQKLRTKCVSCSYSCILGMDTEVNLTYFKDTQIIIPCRFRFLYPQEMPQNQVCQYGECIYRKEVLVFSFLFHLSQFLQFVSFQKFILFICYLICWHRTVHNNPSLAFSSLKSVVMSL